MKLHEIIERAEEWDQNNFDDIAKIESLSYGIQDPQGNLIENLLFTPTEERSSYKSNGNGMESLFGQAVAILEDQKQASMSTGAKQQLAARLLAPPGRWLFEDQNCPPALRQLILNWKIEHWSEPEKLILLRQHIDPRDPEPYIRAVLSDKYEKFDHFEYLTMINEALKMDQTDPNLFNVERNYLHDSMSFYLSFPMDLDTGLQDFGNGTDGLRGDKIRRAVRISNDETGRGSARIEPAVWMMVCGNGAYGWRSNGDALAVRHVGLTTFSVRVLVADMIMTAFSQSQELAEAFIATQAKVLNRRTLGDLIEDWTRDYRLPLSISEGWKENFAGRPSTWWDHINYVTLAAQSESEELGLDIEKMAGAMIYAQLPAKYLAE